MTHHMSHGTFNLAHSYTHTTESVHISNAAGAIKHKLQLTIVRNIAIKCDTV